MSKQDQQNGEYFEIDLLHIAKLLWQKIWLIACAGILCGVIGFSAARFGMAPQYQSSVMLYVNGSSVSIGSTALSISTGDLSVARALVNTYKVIMNNRTTLEKVIRQSGVKYNYAQLSRMITADSVNSTEVMRVTVTCGDPYEAALIANTIADVLPARVSDIMDGSSMRIVDSAVPNLQKVSPSITKYAAIGMLLGILVACLILVVKDLLDDVIHSEDYLTANYDIPVLAAVPDLLNTHGSKYGKYGKYGPNKYGYYEQSDAAKKAESAVDDADSEEKA